MIQPVLTAQCFCQRLARRLASVVTTMSTTVLVAIACLMLTVGQASADESIGGSANEVDAIIDYTQRIIGGRPATIEQWPSVVALVSPGPLSAVDRQFCGGTVVASRWVMTAAHCIYNSFNNVINSSSVRIIEGVSNLRFDPIQEEHLVVNIIPHPLYDHDVPASYNDIALLELATELDAPPVNLFVGNSEYLTGQNGWIVGWGAISFESAATAIYPDDLRAAAVPFVSRDVCNAPNSYNGYVVGFLTCAGFPSGGVDTCVGDSGGPLFGEVDGVMQQIGITSFGQGCAEPNFYGIYTHIPSYIPWLANYITVPAQPNPPTGDNIPRANNQVVADASDGGASLAALWLLAFVLLKSVFLTGCVGSNAPVTVSRGVTGEAAGNAVKSETEVKSMTAKTEDNSRPGIRMDNDDIRIGQSREIVMAGMQHAGLDNFDCQGQRVAMVGSKRAFLLERCSREINPSDWTSERQDSTGPVAGDLTGDGVMLLADMQPESIAVYFIDQQLVRMDVMSAYDDDDIVTMLDQLYVRQDELWAQGPDQIRHQPGSVQLIDADVAARIPKLFE